MDRSGGDLAVAYKSNFNRNGVAAVWPLEAGTDISQPVAPDLKLIP
jgi:hypothetical protein